MSIPLSVDPHALAAGNHASVWRLTLPLALAYILLGAPGLLLGSPTPVFPSAGLALAAVLWFGYRALPGLWLGAVLLNLGLHWFVAPWLGTGPALAQVALSALIASGATLQAWAGAWLVRHWQGEHWRTLALERDALRFLLLGGVLAGLVSAAIGAGGLLASGRMGVTDFAYTGWTWYVGDTIGILIFAPLTLTLLDRQAPLWRERRRRLLLPMLITLALAVMAFHGAGQWEGRERQVRLGQIGEAIVRDLDNRLHTHHEVLSALQHFIEAKPDLSFAEFERFTRATLTVNPELLALSFNPLVSAAERDTFEARLSQQVPTGRFEILERDSDRRPVRAGWRPEHAPITYIVPWDRNQAVLGYDNYSEPVRRAATERVRANRRLTVAAPIVLGQDEAPRTGMLEMLPVEDHQADAADGWPRLLGFVVGVIGIDDLIALATQGKIPDGLRLDLIESRVPSEARDQSDSSRGKSGVLYPTDEEPGANASHPGDHWRGQLRVGDYDWTLVLSATPAYVQQHRSWVAWGVGVGGLLFAALLQIQLLGFTGRNYLSQQQNLALEAADARLRDLNADLKRQVADQTAELRLAKERLEAMISAMPDLVFRVDREGRFLEYYSDAASDFLLSSPADFLGKTIREVLPPQAADTIMAALEEAMRLGRHRGSTYSLPLPQGEHWFELSIAAMGGPDHPGSDLVMLVHEITRRKAAEAQIQALNADLEAKVAQRTATLQAEIAERKAVEQALRLSEQRYRELTAELEQRVEERTEELRDANAELNRLATTDSLTGAWNRRYFEQAVGLEIARRDRYGEPALALLLFDIDHFKRINDQHGHPVGDQVLVEFVQRVRHRLRASDVLARWGGEEFVVLLPHADTEQAVTLAEKLRQLFAAEPFPVTGSLTASFGVAAYQAGESLANWLKRADDALYAAKAGGRNRVSLG